MQEKILLFEEIDRLAIKIAKNLKKGDCLGLIGDLGTGKTTITKKICGYFGIKENIKSPTFTYVIEYKGENIKINHFDVYRIVESKEIYEIGFEDYIGDMESISIIEWANNIIDEMPEDTIYIELDYFDEKSRKVSIYKLKNGEKKYVDFCDNDNN